jgi:hypothetical protein
VPYAQAEIKEPKPREPKVGAERKVYMSDRELRIRGLRVYTNGSKTHRNRVRTAKFLGFNKDSKGNIYVRYV